MSREAPLEQVDSGLAPVGEGWFVVNVRDAAWLTNEAFGLRCIFESDPRVLRNRPELAQQRFPQVGFALAILAPGKPSGLYHAESNQEDFFVLAGECMLLVEGESRFLRAWDFVHCPPGTAHAFVGAGDGPCVLLMIGARTPDRSIVYPADELARRHDAGVETETSSASEAYENLPHWRPQRPDGWAGVPWSYPTGGRT